MDWIIPSLQEEMGEFERVANTFGIKLSSLVSLFQTGTVEKMDEETWSKLENTDSWETVTLEKVFEAADQVGRDAKSLLENFKKGKPMQMPIVLAFANGRMHLVSGNTRLMLCRAIGEKPQFFKLQSTF